MKINPYQNANNRDYAAYLNKMVQNASGTAQQGAASSALSQMGLAETDSLKKAYSLYKQGGLEANKTQMEATDQFLKTASGTEAQKLTTIAVASQKGIEPTAENLEAVHSALNDSANESLTIEGLSETGTQDLKALKAQVSAKEKLESLPPAVKARLLNLLAQLGVKGQAAEEALTSLASGDQGSLAKLKALLPAGVIQQLQDRVNIELLKASIDSGMAVDFSGKGTSPIKGLTLTDNALGELGLTEDDVTLPDLKAVKAWLESLSGGAGENVLQHLMAKLSERDSLSGLSEAGMVGASEVKAALGSPQTLNERLKAEGDQRSALASTQTLDSSQSEILAQSQDGTQTQVSDQTQTQDPEAYFEALDQMMDQILSLLQSGYGSDAALSQIDSGQIKKVVITEVTVAMANAKNTFDSFKAEALKQFNDLNLKATPAQLSEAVTKVALKLDHIIMNTDLTLYTDMKSERSLMGLSADLQEVAQMAKQSPEKALAQLKQVQAKLEQFVFSPSKERVEARLTETAKDKLSLEHTWQAEGPKLSATGGAKGVLDLLRHLGLNREQEVMDQLMSAISSSDKTAEKKETFKDLLMHLDRQTQADDEQLVKAVEKGLSHLTGQQLLNRSDAQQDTQSLFFSVPLAQGDQDAKLYVKARKSANRMDWENCSLYLLVDLKQYGETGIRVNVSSKQLSVTVSNADASIMDVMKPVAKQILEDLKEVGYLPSEIKYSPYVKPDPVKLLGPETLSGNGPSPSQGSVSVDSTTGLSKGGFEWQV